MVSEQSVNPIGITKILFLLCVSALLQAILSVHARLFGYVPDVFLCVVAMIGLFGGVYRGLWLGFIFGIFADALFRTTPFGLSALQLALVGYSCGVVRSAMLRSAHWMIPIVVFISSLFGIAVFVLSAAMIGKGYLISLELPLMMGVVSLLNALIAAPLWMLVRWAVDPTSRSGLNMVRV